MANADRELRQAILKFDKSRGQTGADYVNGKITRLQADSEFEDDISELIAVFHKSEAALLDRIKEEVIGEDYTCLKSHKEYFEWCSYCSEEQTRTEIKAEQRTKLDNIAKEIRGEHAPK